MPTVKELRELIADYKKVNCPSVSKLKKAELERVARRLGVLAPRVMPQRRGRREAKVRETKLRETKRASAIKAVKPLTAASKKFSSGLRATERKRAATPKLSKEANEIYLDRTSAISDKYYKMNKKNVKRLSGKRLVEYKLKISQIPKRQVSDYLEAIDSFLSK